MEPSRSEDARKRVAASIESRGATQAIELLDGFPMPEAVGVAGPEAVAVIDS